MTTYMKLAGGSRRPRRWPPSALPKKPKDLTGEASSMWDQTAPQLLEAGHLAKIDGAALESLCRTWAIYHQAAQTLDRDGDAITLKNGRKIVHPAWKIYTRAAGLLFRYTQQLGMTPLSRARILKSKGDYT